MHASANCFAWRLVKRYTIGMNYKIVIHQEAQGGFWGEVPALPGCVSQGDTLPELKANIREAIEGYLDVMNRDNNQADKMTEALHPPPSTTHLPPDR